MSQGGGGGYGGNFGAPGRVNPYGGGGAMGGMTTSQGMGGYMPSHLQSQMPRTGGYSPVPQQTMPQLGIQDPGSVPTQPGNGIPNAGTLNLGFRGMPADSDISMGQMGGSANGGWPRTGGMTPAPQMPMPRTGGEFGINSPGKIGYQGPMNGRNAFAGSMLYGQMPGGMNNAPMFNGGGMTTGQGMPPQDQYGMNKAGNIYGGGQPGQFGGQGYQPGAGWQQMLDIYANQRNQNMGQQANFGRYPDGTPIADPNTNFRANARQPFYGGGWGQ